MGVLVLGGYGYQRNAFPMFEGDEWLPQLVSIALFFSVLAAFFSLLPWLDLMVARAFAAHAGAAGARRRWPGARYVLVQAVAALVFLACVASIEHPLAQSFAFVAVTVVGALFSLETEFIWGGWRAPQRMDAGIEIGFLTIASNFMQLTMVLTVSVLVFRRLPGLTGIGGWLPAVAVAMVIAIYRVLFLSVLQDAAPKSKTIGGAVSILVIGALCAAEIVRLAGLGNLPNAHLVLERDAACGISRHLQLPQVEAACSSQPSPAQLPLHADIVSRVGGLYVLAAPGALAQRPAGRCQFIHAPGVERPLAADASTFRCADVPRDAVKAVLR